jgi:hypothetical protein
MFIEYKFIINLKKKIFVYAIIFEATINFGY